MCIDAAQMFNSHKTHHMNQTRKVKAYCLYFSAPADGHMPCPAWQHMGIWTHTKSWVVRTHWETFLHTVHLHILMMQLNK